MRQTIRVPRRALVIGALLIAACSSLPDTEFPPYREFDVVAHYEFDSPGPPRIDLPQSTDDLTIYELETEPPARDRFGAGGQRYRVLPAGTRSATLRCRGRIYDPSVRRAPEMLFPDAARVRVRE